MGIFAIQSLAVNLTSVISLRKKENSVPQHPQKKRRSQNFKKKSQNISHFYNKYSFSHFKSEFLIGGSTILAKRDTKFSNPPLFMHFRVGLHVLIAWPIGKKFTCLQIFLAGDRLEPVWKKWHFLTNWAILAFSPVLFKIFW